MEPPRSDPERARQLRQAHAIALAYSLEYEQTCALLQRHGARDALLYSLLRTTGCFRRLRCIAPKQATVRDMADFHCEDYLAALRAWSSIAEGAGGDDAACENGARERERIGLVDECAPFAGLARYAAIVAGASLQLAEALATRRCLIGINWGGGRHHAKRDSASGFCFVNDCVLAILRLQRSFDRVLYVDIDVHHGDGVEEAFLSSRTVCCLSFHRKSRLFFPGTGSAAVQGEGAGRGKNVNVPLGPGIRDGPFLRVFGAVLDTVAAAFRPTAVVMCCGADALGEDPIGGMNLSARAIAAAVARVARLRRRAPCDDANSSASAERKGGTSAAEYSEHRCGGSERLPLLVLGGGGYNPAATARCWTAVTAVLTGTHLAPGVPEDDPFFDQHGPSYQMITPCVDGREDTNAEHVLCATAKRAMRIARGGEHAGAARSLGATRSPATTGFHTKKRRRAWDSVGASASKVAVAGNGSTCGSNSGCASSSAPSAARASIPACVPAAENSSPASYYKSSDVDDRASDPFAFTD